MNTQEPLTPEQSLTLITRMINQAKVNVKHNSFYFLVWGWTIMICNLGIFVMIQFLHIRQPFWIWFLTVPAAIVSGLYGRKHAQEETTTHLDSINKWLWIGFGVICFTVVMFGSRINYQINGVIITMCAVPTFVSGIILRFRPLLIGGICFWLSGIVIFLLPVTWQFLVAAAAIAGGYLIPGYLLRSRPE